VVASCVGNFHRADGPFVLEEATCRVAKGLHFHGLDCHVGYFEDRILVYFSRGRLVNLDQYEKARLSR